jgi:SAM-dependent methyltransferase
MITYCDPADSKAALKAGEIDVIFSQAVMEHVDDVEQVYRSCYRWLKPGGVMSHTIGFDSHGVTNRWNGHWSIGSTTWTLIRGRRPWLINRLPCSAHVELMQRAGFHVIAQEKCYDTPLSRDDLSAEFSALSDEDLRTSAAFVQAVKAIR